jgi:magnesium transporter
MFLALINSAVIQKMLGHVGNIIELAIFVPVIMAMSGNTGMQSATIFVRELALGNVHPKKMKGIAARETVLGFSMGLICGIAGGFIAWCLLTLTGASPESLSRESIGLVVFISILCAMTFSSCFGSITPLILAKFGIDPAVSAGPFVTTLNDITASVIYFSTTYCLINHIMN